MDNEVVRIVQHRRPSAARSSGALLVALLAAMSAFCFSGAALAEAITRQQAIEKVMDVIVPASLSHSVTAFLGLNPLVPGNGITPAFEGVCQYAITSPTWFCWVDDDPRAFFEHPTRYVFIDANTGQTAVIVERWWPVLNGIPLFMSDAEWNDPALVIYSCIHTQQLGGAP